MQNVLRKTTGINTLGASTFMKAPALDPQEALTITANLVISQLILLAVGCVGAVALAGLSSGDWGAAVLGFSWVGLIGQSLTALDLIPTLAAGCGLAAAFTIVAYLFEKRALSTEKGRQSIMHTRQGVNGELARLPFPALVALMALTGFSEELLFRFALMGIVAHLVALALPAPAAALIALFVASIAFWFSHVRYRDLATTVLTLGLALVLGIAFLVTGSLAVVAIAHALYNLCVLVVARVQMSRDPDYFGGPAPTRAMLDQLEREEKTNQTPSQ